MRELCAGAAILLAAQVAWGNCQAALGLPAEKVRPYGAPATPLTAPLACARNEYCSFQIIVTATGEGCRIADVNAAGFAHGSRRIPDTNVTVYRQEFMPVFYRSSSQGDLGEWPDPLIPRIDPEYGEARNAFAAEVRLISPVYWKYEAQGGRTAARTAPGSGRIVPGGRFASQLEQRFEIQVVRPGAAGEATFRWRSEPGAGTWSAVALTSASAVPLENGVTVSFADGQFTAGDYWFFAGPRRQQPVWVDVLIPSDAAPGIYAGQAQVAIEGAARIFLPVQIEILDFSLPSTSSLANYFGMYWPGVARTHCEQPVSRACLVEIGQAYARAALRNGITVSSDGLEPQHEFDEGGNLVRAGYTEYDDAIARFMDGTGTPRGARWTSLRVPPFQRYEGKQLAAVLRDFVRHAGEREWTGRLFAFPVDEPRSPRQFAELAEQARLLREIAPEIPRLVTTDLNPSLLDLVTRWAPVVNRVEPKFPSLRDWWRSRAVPRRADYDARLRAGDSLWWYQSCQSHGCEGTGRSPAHDNWPSYMVDISAVANRVFGLLSVHHNISGILYWDVAYAHHYDPGPAGVRVDPWQSLYHFGGNGDGSLFYPGRPERIGGTRPIAIESLRLKMIRDSLVDADYAALLKQLGEEAFVRQEISRVVQGAYRWNADPQAWLELRARLGRRIVERSK